MLRDQFAKDTVKNNCPARMQQCARAVSFLVVQTDSANKAIRSRRQKKRPQPGGS